MRNRAGKHSKPVGCGRAILLACLFLVFFAGLFYALYPLMTGAARVHEIRKVSQEFLDNSAASDAADEDRAGDAAAEQITEDYEAERPYPELLAAMRVYNEQIYAEGQSGLCDAWAYTAPSFDLTEYGIADDVIGVLSIPKISLEMPIYLGATYDHMAAGAAHLSQTSLPIGGENVNSVIAGHRGWSGAPYFLNLDKLDAGDEITITNLWETLTYRVCATKVIEPNDIDAVLIQPGRDILTLITCHPYASGGRYRLVVYCERVITTE